MVTMSSSFLARGAVAKHYPGIFTGLHFGNHFGTSGVKVAQELSCRRRHVPCAPSPDSPDTCSFGQVSKPEMCQRIGAVALVDDSLDYARQCSQAGHSWCLRLNAVTDCDYPSPSGGHPGRPLWRLRVEPLRAAAEQNRRTGHRLERGCEQAEEAHPLTCGGSVCAVSNFS